MFHSRWQLQIVLLATLILSGLTVLGHAQAPIQPNDLVLGLSDASPEVTLETVRGPVVDLGGEFEVSFWDEPFIQSVEFDNLNGLSHNPQGNLLGLNFGPGSVDGGSIFNLAAAEEVDTSQMIGDTLGLGGDGISSSRLGGLSVSPDNSLIAVTGYDSGRVIVYDYAAGNGKGEGASLTGARESQDGFLNQSDTQGTTWLDSTHVLTFAADGSLMQIDAATMADTILAKVDTGDRAQANRATSTDLEYNPAVSPFLYASYGTFDRDSSETINSLFVLDPNDNFSVVKTVDHSESMGTIREIALDTEGNLFLSQFSGTVDVIPNAVDPDSLSDNNSIEWYIPIVSATFNGIDVALGLPIDPTLVGDFNGNGVLDAPDIDDLTGQSASGANDLTYDLTGDGVVNVDDVTFWAADASVFNSWVGDLNLDKEFNSTDLTLVLGNGKYETGDVAVWSQGDFNGDGVADSSDLSAGLANGGYEDGPKAATAAVPEPTSLLLGILGALAAIGIVRRR